jgi:hypothetical protein
VYYNLLSLILYAAIGQVLDDAKIIDIVECAVAKGNAPILRMLLGIVAPKRTSTTSEREYHAVAFKNSLISRYECSHPSNSSLTKCMILNHYFSTNEVVAAHILGLTNSFSFAAVGLNYETDVWSDRNGVLVYKDIEKKYESQDIVSLFFIYVVSILTMSDFLSRHIYMMLKRTSLLFKYSMMTY